VHVDPGSGRPRPLDAGQLAVWGPSAGDRRVRARLTHGDPPEAADSRPWRFRAADLDVAGHVNNAAYWTVVEEDLRRLEGPLAAEVEHRGAALDGDAVVRRDGDRWWVCAPDGQIHASFVVGGRTVDP
jgi:acyl-ACP thioesterase